MGRRIAHGTREVWGPPTCKPCYNLVVGFRFPRRTVRHSYLEGVTVMARKTPRLSHRSRMRTALGLMCLAMVSPLLVDLSIAFAGDDRPWDAGLAFLPVLWISAGAETGQPNELAVCLERPLAEIELRMDTTIYLISHANALWAFQEAIREPWQAAGPPDWAAGRDSRGASFCVRFRDNGMTKDWALMMVEKEPHSTVWCPVRVGMTWCREDSLLARLIRVLIIGRRPGPGDLNPWSVTDHEIVGGFQAHELRWIDFPELTQRVQREEEADYKMRAVEKGEATLDGRQMMVTALLRDARRLMAEGKKAEALEAIERAERIPRENDVLPDSYHPWSLEVRDLCLTWKADIVYLPSHDLVRAKEVLNALLALHRSREWVPTTDDPKAIDQFRERNEQAIQNIEKKLRTCEE